MNYNKKLNITVFYCINAFNEKSALPFVEQGTVRITYVKMACSSMVKDIYLLKAFEAGADHVVVFVCPEEACRYIEGSIRAAKRVARVKGILDEIGLGGNRLSIFNARLQDDGNIVKILNETTARLTEMGPLFAAD